MSETDASMPQPGVEAMPATDPDATETATRPEPKPAERDIRDPKAYQAAQEARKYREQRKAAEEQKAQAEKMAAEARAQLRKARETIVAASPEFARITESARADVLAAMDDDALDALFTDGGPDPEKVGKAVDGILAGRPYLDGFPDVVIDAAAQSVEELVQLSINDPDRFKDYREKEREFRERLRNPVTLDRLIDRIEARLGIPNTNEWVRQRAEQGARQHGEGRYRAPGDPLQSAIAARR